MDMKANVHPMPSSSGDPFPIAYLITITCYGTHLHGDEKGSVDRHHNWFETPSVPPETSRRNQARRLMKFPPYQMDVAQRALILEAIQDICRRRRWTLIAAHVRCRHVHCVVSAAMPPEPVMNAMKACISRKLNESGLEPHRSRRWTRHGSTKYLWTERSVEEATEYVLEGQGEPMETFPKQSRDR
jgi:REP element-mobilizing transposase RayT